MAATAIAAAKAKLAKCYLAADLIPAPGNVAAALECLTFHALAMAGIIATYNAKVGDILDDHGRDLDLRYSEHDSRVKQYEISKNRYLRRESVRNEFQIKGDSSRRIWNTASGE